MFQAGGYFLFSFGDLLPTGAGTGPKRRACEREDQQTHK
jgi:hypothetical protein